MMDDSRCFAFFGVVTFWGKRRAVASRSFFTLDLRSFFLLYFTIAAAAAAAPASPPRPACVISCDPNAKHGIRFPHTPTSRPTNPRTYLSTASRRYRHISSRPKRLAALVTITAVVPPSPWLSRAVRTS